MGRLTITLLFCKPTEEPPAILQCDKSGEYFPFHFQVWKDALHYLSWAEQFNEEPRKHESYELWCEEFGYYDEEEFRGDHNDINNTPDCTWFLSNGGIVEGTDNLKMLSVWTMKTLDHEN